MSKTLHLRSLLFAGAATACLTTVASPVLAQDGGATIEELVVTAEKREQSLQDVPVAVSAFTSEKRDILGINTIQDFSRMTPSLTYTNNDRLSIRGFGRLTNQIGSDPSVATYSDGVFSNSLADSSTPSLFIERTEILRGPQGTLYGRNSIGGTINVISKRPTEDFRAEARLHLGNYRDVQVDALVSGPITEHLRFLIGGAYQQRSDGYIENIGPTDDIGTADRHILEAQLEADLGENVTARLRYSSFKWNDTYGVGNTLGNNISPYDRVAPAGSGSLLAYYNPTYGYTGPENPGVTDPYKIDANRRTEGNLANHHRLHFDVTWNMETMTLKYIGGFQQYRYRTNPSGDYDGTSRTGTISIPVPATPVAPGLSIPGFTATGISTDTQINYAEDQRWFSNELNLASTTDAPLQWIVGLYQYYQDYDQPITVQVFGDPALRAPVNSPYANPNGYVINRGGHLETNSWAAFGQIDWKFAETWKLTAGLRYTDDEKEGYDTSRTIARTPGTALLLAGCTTLAATCTAATLAATQAAALDATTSTGGDPTIQLRPGGGLIRYLDGQWDAVTGTLGVQWTPDDDTNAYLRYSRGYKSGGFYGASGLTPDFSADPEYVDSYELGIKKNWSRLQVNGALFWNDYQGLQAPIRVLFNGVLATNFLNLDAETYGIELETIWSPIDALQIMVNYNHLNATITNGCCFVDVADPLGLAPGARKTGTVVSGQALQTLVGNQLVNSPENKVSVSATYTWELESGSLMASGSYIWTDDAQTELFANPLYTVPNFEVADFRLIYKDGDDRYTAIAFVKNAFDEVAYNTSSGDIFGGVGVRRYVGLILPRTYGIELQFRY
jgi:iron complex outermembrane receptor protein